MIYPKFIKEDDTIGVTAPSDGVVEKEDLYRLDSAINNFNKRGFKIKETNNVRTSVKGKSSSSIEQAKQLESLFEDDSVDAIICLAGGDFLTEMISEFDFSKVKNNPKWLQGYSDPTWLLYTITTNLDIATIYSDNFKSFGMNPWHKSLENNLEILKGNLIEQNSYDKYEKDRVKYIIGDESYNLTENVKWEGLNGEKNIEIEGRIIGGCLDLLTELFGTRFDKTKEFIDKYKDDGIIWYFDNCELTSEQIIRTMWKFKDNGWFNYTKGIVFGRSAIESSCYDISFKEALIHSLNDLNIPIIINTDIGHVAPRMTIINGSIAKISLDNGIGKIKFILK